jgi:hypothetical protein
VRPALHLALITTAFALTCAPARAADDAVADTSVDAAPAMHSATIAAMGETIASLTTALLAMPVGPLADAVRRIDPDAAMADLPPDATVADMVHADPQAAGRQARITGDAAAGAARDIAAAMPVLTAMARDLAAQWQLRLADARRRNP